MAAEFEITGRRELEALARDLRDPLIVPEVRARFNVAARPMIADVERRALAIPSKGPKHTGLRAKIARAARATVTTTASTVGLRVFVDPDAMPANQRTMPAKMQAASFEHPVYGDRETWVTQRPRSRYFSAGRKARIAGARQAVEQAADTVATRITRGRH